MLNLHAELICEVIKADQSVYNGLIRTCRQLSLILTPLAVFLEDNGYIVTSRTRGNTTATNEVWLFDRELHRVDGPARVYSEYSHAVGDELVMQTVDPVDRVYNAYTEEYHVNGLPIEGSPWLYMFMRHDAVAAEWCGIPRTHMNVYPFPVIRYKRVHENEICRGDFNCYDISIEEIPYEIEIGPKGVFRDGEYLRDLDQEDLYGMLIMLRRCRDNNTMPEIIVEYAIGFMMWLAYSSVNELRRYLRSRTEAVVDTIVGCKRNDDRNDYYFSWDDHHNGYPHTATDIFAAIDAEYQSLVPPDDDYRQREHMHAYVLGITGSRAYIVGLCKHSKRDLMAEYSHYGVVTVHAWVYCTNPFSTRSRFITAMDNLLIETYSEMITADLTTLVTVLTDSVC